MESACIRWCPEMRFESVGLGSSRSERPAESHRTGRPRPRGRTDLRMELGNRSDAGRQRIKNNVRNDQIQALCVDFTAAACLNYLEVGDLTKNFTMK